jgi:uncharacterized Fe-S cluster-containing MiaB family protein
MPPTEKMSVYPEHPRERDRWILSRRYQRNAVDPRRPHEFLVEEERAESGEIVSVATIFLNNRECPWRCLMCDLWKNTLTETVPLGAIAEQIDYALAQFKAGVPPAVKTLEDQERIRRRDDAKQCSTSQGRRAACPALRQIKLYNSGSFFDPRAIPPEDHISIADRARAFERVTVECHPALVGESALEFRDLLNALDASEVEGLVHRPSPGPSREGNSEAARAATLHSFGGVGGGFVSAPDGLNITAHGAGAGQKLEVAMGLETAHTQVLEKLNKRMTLDQFRRAAKFLRENDIALRVFVLVKPPFLDEDEALHWAKRSMDFAFDCGATVVSLIPTRLGNGAMDTLAERGEFSPPRLATLEAALEYGIGLKRGRAFADLWDLEQFSDCKECFARRRARLHEMNLQQMIQRRDACERCGEHTN